jgi:HlyD family secretion protein
VSSGTIEVTISGAGSVRSNQNAEISWKTSGTVGSVAAEIGQQVQAGDELAALDPTTLSSDIIEARSELIDAQQALEDLQKPQALEIAQAQSDLADAKAALYELTHPSETAIAEAQIAVMDAQDAADKAQGYVDGLKYARASQETITTAQATYLVAKYEVQRLQQEYKKIKGDPTKNAAKANALARLEAAKTLANRALANLNWLQSKPTQEEIDEKNADLTLAEAQLADAEEVLRKLTTPTEADITLADAVVADAQEKLDTLKAGATENDLTVAQTRVTQAQAELAKAGLTAPFAGTITDIQVMTGDIVSAGTLAFQIDDLTRLFVDLEVSEIDISQIQSGKEAVLAFDAITDKEYHGIVTRIGMVGTNSQGVVNYPVTVEITDGDEDILPGMTAAVSIVVAQAEDVLVVPNQAVRSSGAQRTVTVLFEGQQIQVPVTVGLVGDTMTEVTGDSLREGDVIVVNGSSSSSTTTTTQNRDSGFPGDVPPDGGFIGP